MTRRQTRLLMIGGVGVVLALAVALVLIALRDQIVFFHTPADVAAMSIEPGQRIRLGGLVKEGSVVRDGNGTVRFVVTDTEGELAVRFHGILPDLFREGQGVVAEGVLEAGGLLAADTVLARHDENYMPREVADALKEKGVWQGDEQ